MCIRDSERGAFTGAAEKQVGKFELAHKGTLFLDEVGDMSLRTQAKVLRALQEGEIERIGSQKQIQVDVRVVAATNKDLEQEIEQGRFREDLYFRLSVIPVRVPALREHPEDVPVLVEHFAERMAREGQARRKAFTPEALEALQAHPWRGNVRELENAVQGLALLVRGPVVQAEDLPLTLRGGTAEGVAAAAPAAPPGGFSMADAERAQIARALAHTGGRKAPAARLLGIDVKTLTSKIRLYGLLQPELVRR